LYSSPNVIRGIKLIAVRWERNGAHRGEKEMHAVFWRGSLKVRGHVEDLRTRGSTILKGTLMKSYGRSWISFKWLRIETGDEMF
jgi:hypothetical protein